MLCAIALELLNHGLLRDLFSLVISLSIVFKTFGNTPLIKERFVRLVSGLLRVLLKVLNKFFGILWDPIALLFLSNFTSCCISFFVTGFMDK